MENRLGIGVIGCGWAGEQHVRAYLQIKDARVVALADIDTAKLRHQAKKWGIEKQYVDYKALLRDPEVEAVSVCLPHYLHCRVTVDAAEAGKHVLCEKPMANTLDEADTMIEAAKKAAVTLMIAEPVRFHPINIELRKLVVQNILGEVFLARIFRDHEMHRYLTDRPWFLDRAKAGGGIWMSGGIHDVDALRMILGDVKAVSLYQAKSVFPAMEGDDTVAALLKFMNGAVGVVTESFSTKTFRPLAPNGCPTVINGSSGTVFVQGHELEIYTGRKDEEDLCIRRRVAEKDTFLEEIRHFIECVKMHAEPIPSGEEEWESLSVVLAGYESLSLGGAPVEVQHRTR
ncbi:MAG: Gfo/Idh/MocA family oxidoreductase [Candidatus Bathyarchaeia archaeon]